MNKKEKILISTFLFFVAFFILLDIASDSNQGFTWWHVTIETIIAICALLGFLKLLKELLFMKNKLKNEEFISQQAKSDLKLWKEKSESLIYGLNQAIDSQLTAWSLTLSEKEVSLLLLKGLTIKEIAEIRQTSEKTVRSQCSAIYSKSGLSGKAELSAFFLEDLLTIKEKE